MTLHFELDWYGEKTKDKAGAKHHKQNRHTRVVRESNTALFGNQRSPEPGSEISEQATRAQILINLGHSKITWSAERWNKGWDSCGCGPILVHFLKLFVSRLEKRNVLVSMKLCGLWRPEGQLGRPFWAKPVLRVFAQVVGFHLND